MAIVSIAGGSQSLTVLKVVLLIFIGLGLFFSALALGAVSLPFSDVVACLWTALTQGEEAARQAYPRTAAILLHIRLPRAIAALLAGSALAVSGPTPRSCDNRLATGSSLTAFAI